MDKKTKNKFPFIVGGGLLALLLILSLTNFFSPLAQYIHDYTITPVGAIGCLVAAVIALYGVYKILSKLGQSLLPEDDEKKER